MQKHFFLPAILIIFISRVSIAQYTPFDRCIEDSLYRIMPHESKIQQGKIYLELAQLWDTVPQKSLNYIVMALRISMEEKNNALKARTRLMLGDYFSKKRMFIQAQENYLAALKTFQYISDKDGEIDALEKIGYLNSILNNFADALEYCSRGLVVAQRNNDLQSQGMFRNQMAQIYEKQGDYQKAMFFFTEASSNFNRTGDKMGEIFVQHNIGGVLINQNRNNEAIAHYDKLIGIADTTNGFLMGVLYTRLAHAYAMQKKHSNSLKYNQKALYIRQKVNCKEGENNSLINIAGDYFLLGMADSGLFYLDKGLNLALKHNRRNLVENSYRHLYTFYQNRGDFEKALYYYTRYISESEIIAKERNESNISILETKQHIQKMKESEIRLLRNIEIQTLNIGNQVQHSVFIQIINVLAGISMLIFVFLLLYNRIVRRKLQLLYEKLSAEIIERQATEQQTSERERQYRFLSENSGEFITHIDSQNKRIYASPASVKLYGYEPDEILQMSSADLIHPDFHAYFEIIQKEIIVTRTPRHFSFQAVKKDGAVFWAEAAGNPLFDQTTGEFKGIVAVTRDIQARKTKELEIMEGTRQKENLLKEIHHRVKNNFAILVSLINMQMAQTKNQELLKSLTNLQLRIRTMALVHEMLYRSKDFENISFPDYLRSLSSVIAGTYNRRNISMTFEADDIVMDIDAAIPIGLVVNEILSNSYLHAFPDNRSGNIQISFKHNPENNLNTLVLKDDGIGMPTGVNPDKSTSMGLQIIQILCKQIEGSLVLTNNPGASYTIAFQSDKKS